MIATYDII